MERFYYYRINRKGSRVFFQGVYHAAMQKDWSTITKLVQEFPSAISRIIESGMENAGTEASMKGAFADRMSMEAINFRRYLDYLSAIVTIGPLLGLLGTVTGMIQTFSFWMRAAVRLPLRAVLGRHWSRQQPVFAWRSSPSASTPISAISSMRLSRTRSVSAPRLSRRRKKVGRHNEFQQLSSQKEA